MFLSEILERKHAIGSQSVLYWRIRSPQGDVVVFVNLVLHREHSSRSRAPFWPHFLPTKKDHKNHSYRPNFFYASVRKINEKAFPPKYGTIPTSLRGVDATRF